MPLLIIIGVIVAIAIYDDQNKRKQAINKKNIIGYDTRTGVPLYEGEKVTGYDTQTGRAIISGREEPKRVINAKEKTPLDKTKISNSILMIIGAALVVFATIVFLTSSWDSIPNIIKPIVLLFIQGVFFGAYKMCTGKLDIPKTGIVFRYLSFAFIPIILLSLSCFELIGESLSIGGEYASLYFMICFIISDIIYKIYTIKNNDLIIKVTSYFLELLAIVCLGDFIKLEFIPLLLISIHTTIIYILIHFNYLDKKAYNAINLVIIILTMIFTYNLASENTFLYYLPFIVYTLLFFFMYFIKKDSQEQRNCLILFIFNYIFTITFINSLEIPKQFFYLLFILPLIVFANFTKNKTVRNILPWLILAFTAIITISNVLLPDNSYFDTLTFLMATIISVLELVFFEEGKTEYKIATYIGLTLLLINTCYRLNITELSKYILMIIALLVYLLEKAFPYLKDSSSKHIVPIYLCLESIILGMICISDESAYTVIIPLILMFIYSKIEQTPEEYVLVPTLATLTLFFKTPTPLSVSICSILVLIYSLLSAFKGKTNVYTFVSLLSIIFGLPNLNAGAYVVFLALGVWSIIHLIANEDNKEIYKLSAVASILGIYLKGMNDLNIGYYSIYFLGLYLALIAITRLVFKKEEKELPLLESIAFIIISLISLIMINEPVDAILMIIIIFIITLFSFVNKYKVLLYCSLAGMIVHIVKQTLEFWASIPIYIYILIIGLTLILFAMFDERLNIKKKDKEKPSQKDNTD